MRNTTSLSTLRRDRRAVSPAISSVILTSAVVVLLLVTVVFANNFLNARMAENEFSAMKQFMQTIGLQVDDVAWTIGRTQTIRYATRFGHVSFESFSLNYSVYVDKGAGYQFLVNYTMGILMFNMPIGKYSMANNYTENIFPSSNRAFLQTGTSAPVSHVYVIEKIPMGDGSFIRVVVAPSLRMLSTTISTGGEVRNYFKFYLPILNSTPGSQPRLSQSVTLQSTDVSFKIEGSITRIKILAVFPKGLLGFDEQFFNFDDVEESVDVDDNSIVEFYVSEVNVGLGLHV